MTTHRQILLWCGVLALLLGACSKRTAPVTNLRHFPADDTGGVVDRARVVADHAVTSDGGGSLRIEATEPVTIRLYEVDSLYIDDSRIIYSAKLRTENLTGEAYLEMWCHFPHQGDYFSRDVENPHGGTTDWVSVEAPFMLQKGQKVKSVRLNLVVLGTGTVWIDDIDLNRAPLSP